MNDADVKMIKWVFHVGKISQSLIECHNFSRQIIENNGDEDLERTEKIHDRLTEILQHINL